MKFFIFEYELFSPWCSIGAPHVQLPACKRCGNMGPFYHKGPGTARIDKGAKWTDIIGSGAVYPPFMVSERVIDTLSNTNARGFQKYSVVIEEIHSKRLRVLPAPQYYYLHVTGRVDIDLEASGIFLKNQCNKCFRSDERSQPRRFVVIEKSWDGSDICLLRNYPSGFHCCTEKFYELASQHKWTNVRFREIESI